MADALLIKTLVVILASVCAISLVARIGLPAAAGYLLAGLVIGPHGLQLIATAMKRDFWPSSASFFSCSWWVLSSPFRP
jgi:monovalent cation:H+ antiporter-2, CPA2 family